MKILTERWYYVAITAESEIVRIVEERTHDVPDVNSWRRTGCGQVHLRLRCGTTCILRSSADWRLRVQPGKKNDCGRELRWRFVASAGIAWRVSSVRDPAVVCSRLVVSARSGGAVVGERSRDGMGSLFGYWLADMCVSFCL